MKNGSPGLRLRQLLKDKQIILPGAFNTLSAQLIEQAGFDAVYISGAGLANGVAGLPDIGLLTLTEVVAQVKYITDVVKIPAIADADTGFGEGVHFLRAMAAFQSAGVAAVQIEDQQFPKRCGHLSGKQLIDAKEMRRKIRALVESRLDPDLMIVARTDARGVTDINDAIDRAKRYCDAGADIVFPEALRSADEFAEFARAVKAPLLANMTEFGMSPALSADVLFDMGYRIVLFPMTLFRVAAGSIVKGLEQLKRDGSSRKMLDKMQTREELYRLIRYDDYEQRDQEIASGRLLRDKELK